MVSLGVSLLLFCSSAAPEVLAGPRFAKGDELHYVGEVVESSDVVENRYRKTHALEVRLFVLETDDTSATCALLTMLTRDADPALATGMASISGKSIRKSTIPPSVRIDFVRIDDEAKAEWLEPAKGTSPINFAKANRKAIPPLPTDAPAEWELGFLPTPGAVGIVAQGSWNGRRCIGLTTNDHSENYDVPDIAPKGWSLRQTRLVSPTERYACTVTREIVRRHGREQIGKIAVMYELQPTNRYVGTRYTEARQEIETAWAMIDEFSSALAKPSKPADFTARAAKIQRYLDEHPGGGGFRIALEALQRRSLAYAAGAVPFIAPTAEAVKKLKPLVLGTVVPDFTVADVDIPANRFRLNAAKGKPVVLLFYKPNSKTSTETLTIAEALAKRYRDTAAILPLAIGTKSEEAAEQRAALKYSVPVFDGSTARTAYRVTSFPQFFIVDAEGKLNWSFDAGVGPEVGYLVKEALDKVIAGNGERK